MGKKFLNLRILPDIIVIEGPHVSFEPVFVPSNKASYYRDPSSILSLRLHVGNSIVEVDSLPHVPCLCALVLNAEVNEVSIALHHAHFLQVSDALYRKLQIIVCFTLLPTKS